MKSFFSKISFLFLLICFNNIVVAQVKFYAKATPLQISVNEYFSYKLIVENGVSIDKINFPDLGNFIVLSGPIQEKYINTVNDVSSQIISVSFVLQPKQVGSFTIEPAAAMVDGRSYKTSSFKIVVNNKGLKNNTQLNNVIGINNGLQNEQKFDDYLLKNGDNIQQKIDQNMQLVLQASKLTCYVGEPIMASYNLYSRLDCESDWTKIPSFTGFSTIDMLSDLNEGRTQKKLNGRLYNVYETRKAQLYPLQAGDIEIEPATLDNTISFEQNGKLLTEQKSITSNKLVVHVLPLPNNGQPKSFSGAVGNYTIEVTLNKKEIASNETGLLIISTSGNGNMQLLTPPKITWPANTDLFDIKIIDNTDQTSMPISGTKTFEVPFVINKQGKYNIPPIEFSFFNPTTKQYKTIYSTGLAFIISKPNPTIAKQNKVASVDDNKFFGNRFLARVLIFGSIIFVILFLVLRQLTAKKLKNNNQLVIGDKTIETKVEVPIVFNTSKNYLEKAKLCLENNECTIFYSLLNDEIKEFCALKYNFEKKIINANSIGNLLDEKQVKNELVLLTQHLLKELELKIFTPFERNNDLSKFYNDAQYLVQQHLLA